MTGPRIDGEPADFMAMPLQVFVDDIATGKRPVHVGKVLGLDQIVEAHRLMEANAAGATILVLPSLRQRESPSASRCGCCSINATW